MAKTLEEILQEKDKQKEEELKKAQQKVMDFMVLTCCVLIMIAAFFWIMNPRSHSPNYTDINNFVEVFSEKHQLSKYMREELVGSIPYWVQADQKLALDYFELEKTAHIWLYKR